MNKFGESLKTVAEKYNAPVVSKEILTVMDWLRNTAAITICGFGRIILAHQRVAANRRILD